MLRTELRWNVRGKNHERDNDVIAGYVIHAHFNDLAHFKEQWELGEGLHVLIRATCFYSPSSLKRPLHVSRGPAGMRLVVDFAVRHIIHEVHLRSDNRSETGSE